MSRVRQIATDPCSFVEPPTVIEKGVDLSAFDPETTSVIGSADSDEPICFGKSTA